MPRSPDDSRCPSRQRMSTGLFSLSNLCLGPEEELEPKGDEVPSSAARPQRQVACLPSNDTTRKFWMPACGKPTSDDSSRVVSHQACERPCQILAKSAYNKSRHKPCYLTSNKQMLTDKHTQRQRNTLSD